MGFLTNLQKNLKSHHLIALVGLVIVVFGIMQYTQRKSDVSDGFGNNRKRYDSSETGAAADVNTAYVAQPANPAGQNEEYAKVSGINTSSYGLPPSCNGGGSSMTDPADLLPRDVNSQWAQLNPAGGADFKNVNLLKAGYHIGIDTIGSSLRNANLQERSEPPNPTTSVSPWLNSTIEPDLMRTPLEIGCGSQ
jgi:hypothetical protein